MGIVRPEKIRIGSTELALPIFFSSVSSIKTNLSIYEYVEVLSALSALNKQFLVSAFDLTHASKEDAQKIRTLLEKTLQAGTTVLMDSGNYESYWKAAQATWQQPRFHEALKQYPCSIAFSFDEQNPPTDIGQHIKLVAERWQLDQAAAGKRSIIPIVHSAPADLPALCAGVVEAIDVKMIAVPERRLGNGILERVATTKAIRAELDKKGTYTALHLLGTGNPISVAMYAIAGADSFDGLEWCQTVVDHDTSLLSHSTHADFFRAQTEWGASELSFQARTLAHNLEFYASWIDRLRKAIHTGDTVTFCRSNLPQRIFNLCVGILGWEQKIDRKSHQ